MKQCGSSPGREQPHTEGTQKSFLEEAVWGQALKDGSTEKLVQSGPLCLAGAKAQRDKGEDPGVTQVVGGTGKEKWREGTGKVETGHQTASMPGK